jgi:aspartyl/asparaginyl beta-hydroxylase (cupin superfamily)
MTRSIIYVWSTFDDSDYENVTTIIEPETDNLSKEVWSIGEEIRSHFGENARITKLMLAQLIADGEITAHKDGGNLKKIHRCHYVLKSNDSCIFKIDHKPYSFKEGEVFEFNNQSLHYVKNSGNEDRVHLICDILD